MHVGESLHYQKTRYVFSWDVEKSAIGHEKAQRAQNAFSNYILQTYHVEPSGMTHHAASCSRTVFFGITPRFTPQRVASATISQLGQHIIELQIIVSFCDTLHCQKWYSKLNISCGSSTTVSPLGAIGKTAHEEGLPQPKLMA